MLAIRMQRTGRSGHAQFRVIVQDSHFHPSRGKIVAQLGSYDPHTKIAQIDLELAARYLNNGAQPSDRVAKLLKSEGVKLPSWVVLTAPKKRSVRNPDKRRSTRPVEAEATAPVEAAVETTPDTAKDTSESAPAEAVAPEVASEPAEAVPEEAPVEEGPATDTPETEQNTEESAPASEPEQPAN